jgi:hypothetical protein
VLLVTSNDVSALLVGLLDCLNHVVTDTQIHRNLDVLYSKVVGWKAKEDDLANPVLAHDNAGSLLQAVFSLPFTIDWNTKGIKSDNIGKIRSIAGIQPPALNKESVPWNSVLQIVTFLQADPPF